MVFVPDSARVGFNPRSTIEELTVKRVSTEIQQRELAGWTPVESGLRVRRTDRGATAGGVLFVDGVHTGDADLPDLVHDLRCPHRKLQRPHWDQPDGAAGVHRDAVHG